jgi:hypothetical protein
MSLQKATAASPQRADPSSMLAAGVSKSLKPHENHLPHALVQPKNLPKNPTFLVESANVCCVWLNFNLRETAAV